MNMKEILHRAKTIGGQWVEGYYAEIDNCSVLFVNEKPLRVDPETVCGYTGLKDKDGRRIFEGDMLKVKNTIYTVSYRAHSGGWQLEHQGRFCAELTQGHRDMLELIGSIYSSNIQRG